ncbi:MAG: hypothetical protein AB8I80_00745, partial [Anaerolineae bacterium]
GSTDRRAEAIDGGRGYFHTRSHVLRLCNSFATLSANVAALKTRAMVVQFSPSSAEVLTKVESFATDSEIVAFLRDPADRAELEPLLGEDWHPEALALGTRVAYLWCPDGVRASRLTGAVDRALGDAVTTRNWATVRKLQALAHEGAS